LRDHLAHAADPLAFTDSSARAADPIRAGEQRRRWAEELQVVLEEIRSIEGFASFGSLPEEAELLADATDGPIVTFNVSKYRSDALLLTPGGMRHVELPGLRHDALTEQVNAFHDALQEIGSDRQAPLLRILEWLWDAAAEPVLAELGYDHEPLASDEAPRPRIWWAPGGMLSMLPIHAAGYHLEVPALGRPRRTVLDRVVSSYTPTIRALRYARQIHSTPNPKARSLIVAMPTTPDIHGSQLRFVPAEVAALRTRLPRVTVLAEPADNSGVDLTELPTRANVFGCLPNCVIAHFACHGENNPEDPSESRLLLHDHQIAPLTVASLASLHLGNAELAYLSACSTALSEATQLIDESIHLTAAFQMAGFPHVIGTLWPIKDIIAADVADAFYSKLLSAPGSPIDTNHAALALHHAVHATRARFPDRPDLWAPYIHAGS
jgi:hypothetical protein